MATSMIVDRTFMSFDSDGDNTAQAIKTTRGKLIALEVSNSNSADAFIQLFDATVANVTVGTTTPNQSFLVPAGDGTVAGAVDKIFTIPVTFINAITFACTTTATGNGDPTTGLVVNAIYV